MKIRVLSLLLSLSLFLSLTGAGTIAYADSTSESTGDSGMKINKTAEENPDGTYTINLEAYATGSKVISEVTSTVPTDIILVLDQSGSMGHGMGNISFEKYQDDRSMWGITYHTRNLDYYEYRHNGGSGNLWYLKDDSYYSVSVTKQQIISYTQTNQNNETLYRNKNNLYVKVAGQYVKVTVNRTRIYRDYTYTYTYQVSGEEKDVSSSGNQNYPSISGTEDNKLYVATADYVYTYKYTDANNNTQTIETSTGDETVFPQTLYKRVGDNADGSVDTRLKALKTAVTNFANEVAEKAKGADGVSGTKDDITHRIAVVGFAGCKNNDPSYINTEIFIGADQYNYGSIDSNSDVYTRAFQRMNTEQGKNNVLESVGALDANGSTYVDKGIDLANGIFEKNPVGSDEKRNRVVIVFTDGAPGWSGTYGNGDYGDSYYGDAAAAASEALTAIGTTKKTYKATVYTVGIFDGADATTAGSNADNASASQRANWFMQKLSSNNGTVQDPSYYLSAADADTLNNIFQKISDNIEEGGSETTLGSSTVIKDIIAPQFELPTNATVDDINLNTYRYTGKDTWSPTTSGNMGATATIDGDKVNVTGFDFAANWCGTETNKGETTYRGYKLVISFDVEVKDGFLGGNGVYTNTSAGVYENSSAQKPLFPFNHPYVDVKIKNIAVTPEDKNVYLMGSLTAEQIKAGATAQSGDVELKLGEKNYGLEDWQHEYVDIVVSYQDEDGNVVTDLNDLRDDTTYKVFVQIKPKKETGKNSKDGETGEGTGHINVFKPNLTFKDGEAWYGDNVPTNDVLSQSLTETKWFHGTTEADTSKMGAAPELNLTYTPDASKIEDGKINTKQDLPVDATVKLNDQDVTEHTTFAHTNCEGKTCTLPADKEFLLHINTCQLKITKTGGAEGEPYVFKIMKGEDQYSEVTIVGNSSETVYELPVGTYTIEEDTGWSWRYRANNGGSAVLSSSHTSDEITCTNTKNKDKWLNGFSTVVKNIFAGQ